MRELRGRIVKDVPSAEGRQADVMIIEPNGDEHLMRCIVLPNRTDLECDPEILDYLGTRYGEEAVYRVALAATLGL